MVSPHDDTGPEAAGDLATTAAANSRSMAIRGEQAGVLPLGQSLVELVAGTEGSGELVIPCC